MSKKYSLIEQEIREDIAQEIELLCECRTVNNICVHEKHALIIRGRQ